MRRTFIFLLLPLLVWACNKNDLKQVESLSNLQGGVEKATDVEIIYSDSSKVKAKLNAKDMTRYLSEDDPKVEMDNGVRVLFYGDSLKVTSSVRAQKGVRYMNKGLTRLEGNVVVVNTQGDTLNTEELYWDETKEKVYSEKFVKVTTPDKIVLAEGFESNLDLTKYKFFNTRSIITLKGDGF